MCCSRSQTSRTCSKHLNQLLGWDIYSKQVLPLTRPSQLFNLFRHIETQRTYKLDGNVYAFGCFGSSQPSALRSPSTRVVLDNSLDPTKLLSCGAGTAGWQLLVTSSQLQAPGHLSAIQPGFAYGIVIWDLKKLFGGQNRVYCRSPNLLTTSK